VIRPQLWVFAGPNGAGKSTLVDRYVRGRIPVVNPDTIALSLDSALDDTARILRAGRIALRERAELLAARQSFGVETTLTGHAELDLMRAAGQAGFKVNLVYVGLRNVRNSISRVRHRVARGGHDVPQADLLRRFDRSIANLPKAITLSDRAILFDNSGRWPRLLLVREGDRARFTATTLPPWAARVLE